MNILLTGATGFIGSHLAKALLARGHRVTGAVRNPAKATSRLPGLEARAIDYNRATTPEAWAPLLDNIDVAINAVGILQESASQRFDVLHHRAPQALFEACAQHGVKRVIQISALGADTGTTPYFRSKKAADDVLPGLGIDYVIVQPSIVFGPGGGSAKLFSNMVRLPLIPVPGAGDQRIQPVFIDDLVDVVAALVEAAHLPALRIPVLGPEALTLKTFYTRLRSALGIRGRPHFLPVPMPFMHLGAQVGKRVPGIPLDPDTLQMLIHGNIGDPTLTHQLLGHPPRPVDEFRIRR